MNAKCWLICALVAMMAFVVPCGMRAEDDKPKDDGKAEEFKGKTFDLAEGKTGKVVLIFPAGKKFKLTVKSEKDTDVNLFIKNAKGKVKAKDDSPGPSCDLDFTSKKGGTYTIEVVNLGKGAKKSTLKVERAKKKEKPKDKE
jgi:hypothetical protein